MTIGEYIKYKRELLGYTQQQFAEILQVSKQSISKWENELTLPNIMTIPSLASLLKTSPEFLVNAIWIGSSGTPVTHFIELFVHEANNDSYLIQIYESKDFLTVWETYDDICKGKNKEAWEKVVSYYEYDKARTFSVKLLEVFEAKISDVYYEFPIDNLLIESFSLDPLIKESL